MENAYSDIIGPRNVRSIDQIVSDFRLKDLRKILKSIGKDISGDQQSLRFRILKLLNYQTPQAKALEEIVIDLCLTNEARKKKKFWNNQIIVNDHGGLQIRPLNRFGNPIKYLEFSHSLPFYKTIISLRSPFYYHNDTINTFDVNKLYLIQPEPIKYITDSYDDTKKEHKIQIILRLEQVGMNCKDHLPTNVKILVNNNECKLPTLNIPKTRRLRPWRSNAPINITKYVKLQQNEQNTLNITWSNDDFHYLAGIFLAQKLSLEDMIRKLKNKPGRTPEKTIEFIKNIMNDDADMGVDSLIFSLMDPLTTLRMKLPIRGVECIHIQCFDGIHFLQMNEHTPKWKCPICRKQIYFDKIIIDKYFLNVIQSSNLSKECEDIILFKDGTWAEKKTISDSNKDNVDNKEVGPKLKRFKYNPLEEKYEPVVASINPIKINDNLLNDRPGPSSTIGSPSILNNLPNTTISGANIDDNGASTSVSTSENSQEKSKQRLVSCVITLD